jgi:hypothetical protein
MAENFECNISVVPNCSVCAADKSIIILALIGEVLVYWHGKNYRTFFICMNCNQMYSGSLACSE